MMMMMMMMKLVKKKKKKNNHLKRKEKKNECFEPLQKLRARIWIQYNMFQSPVIFY